jgi:hypothetical protein
LLISPVAPGVKQAGDLRKVIDVLASHMGLIQLHGHVPRGLMTPGTLPLMPVKHGEIGKVCGAGVPVPGNLLGQGHADVAAFHGERVLVESGQERVVFGQHAAQPGVRPLVHVGDVRHYLDDGPFP